MPNFNTIVLRIKLEEAKKGGNKKEYQMMRDYIAYICLDRGEKKRYLKKNKK